MTDYTKLASQIIENVGGRENVADLSHCVTRLRFILKDESKANDEKIKATQGVITLVKSGGQYQVVIGNEVEGVYKEVLNQMGGKTVDSNFKKKRKAGEVVIDFISSVMNPCLGVLCACGIIKGILAILSFTNAMDLTCGTYMLLSASGDCLFYFFPIALGYTCSKKLNLDPVLGISVGAALVYPSLQGVEMTILGITIKNTFSSTVLPVILTMLFAALIYKPLSPIVPKVVRAFVVPAIVLVISVFMGWVMIGPCANFLSTVICNVVTSIYSLSPVCAGIVLGGLWQVLVMFGIHIALSAIAVMQLMSGQPSSIIALTFCTTFAQTAVVFGIWLKTKDKKLKEITLPAWISGIFGVTEPAIYGVTLPRIKMFVISCIGAALGSGYIGLSNTLFYNMSGLGVFQIPGFIGEGINAGAALRNVFISLVIAIGVSFVLTIIFFKDDEKKQFVIVSPVKGNCKKLSASSDETFSSGVLGSGFVVDPVDEVVEAPIDGKVTTLFPTLHAIGIEGNNGVELLIHIGVDTVKLNGDGFEAYIHEGDKVKQGDKLVHFNKKKIENAGLSSEVIVVITNSNNYEEIVYEKTGKVDNRSKVLTIAG